LTIVDNFIDLVGIFAHNLGKFLERLAELSTRMTRDDDVRTSPRGSPAPAPDFGFEVDPAAEQITRGIEQDIFRGRLRPGEKLREEELAERFDASRHHVREALTRLAQTGIVMKERNRGAYVRRFSADEVRQIYEIREIMQRQAALKIALPATPDTVRGLSSINDAYEDAVRSGDFHRIHETNDRFHTELFSLCGNHLLVSLISNYMDLTYAIRGAAFADPENLDKSREHHRIMLRLLSGTDSWALAQICVDHIQITKELYLSILRESGDEHTPQLGVER
jgi:DNA-binding GntR family transcriptional regulator